MFRNVPEFTQGQELATKYWWNVTQLAASAAQDVFLIVYSSMENTSNGTKSIEEYCAENGKLHMIQELLEDGYDNKKLTSSPKDVFFDIQMTRKVLDKILMVSHEKKDILEKIRKKMRWLTYQRNDISHDMLESMDALKLKLSLSQLKGILRQLYNLAGKFSDRSTEETNEALTCFLIELETHRRFASYLHKDSCQKDSTDSDEEEETNDETKEEKESEEISVESQDRSESANYSEHVVSQGNDNAGDNADGNAISGDTVEEAQPQSCQSIDLKEIGKCVGHPNNRENLENLEIFPVSDTECTEEEEEQDISYDEELMNDYKQSDCMFHEVWGASGPTLTIQVGMYCSHAQRNQFRSVVARSPLGYQVMAFWQECLCNSHDVETQDLGKRCFVPPQIAVRTRSKSLGRKASYYLLQRQKISRKRYRKRRFNLFAEMQRKHKLHELLETQKKNLTFPEEGKCVKNWEEIIQLDEDIMHLEKWQSLNPEESKEWSNKDWKDVTDSENEEEEEEEEEEKEEEKAGKGEPCPLPSLTTADTSTKLSVYDKPLEIPDPKILLSPSNESSSTTKSLLIIVALTSLIAVFVSSVMLLVVIMSAVTVVIVIQAGSQSLNLIMGLSVLFIIGCLTYIFSVIMNMVVTVFIAVIRVTSLLLYFVRYCNTLERRAAVTLQRLHGMSRLST